jgi:hypothetical protein
MPGSLLHFLVRAGLLVRPAPLDNHQFYQPDASSQRWFLGDGSPPRPDPMYSRRAGRPGCAAPPRPVNPIFERFYRIQAASFATFEAREHTAQVVTPGNRERR